MQQRRADPASPGSSLPSAGLKKTVPGALGGSGARAPSSTCLSDAQSWPPGRRQRRAPRPPGLGRTPPLPQGNTRSRAPGVFVVGSSLKLRATKTRAPGARRRFPTRRSRPAAPEERRGPPGRSPCAAVSVREPAVGEERQKPAQAARATSRLENGLKEPRARTFQNSLEQLVS